MGLKKIIYPLDFSGTRKENRVTEKHTLGDVEYRAFSLRNGPFYAGSVVIKEEGSNIPLTPDDDYTCVMHFDDLSKLTPGKDIEGVIVVHNTKVSKNIVVEANIVGGPFAHSAQAIQDAIDELEIDNRNIYWRKVIDKPELFTPPPHIHDIGDVYGFEFIISMLAQIGDTLMVGDNVQMMEIKKRLNELEADFRERHRIHLKDYKNPHRVDAHQTNAYFKEEIDKFLEGVQKQFSDLEPRFKDIQTEFDEVHQRINVLTGTFNNNARQLAANEKQLNRFQKLLADLNRNIDSINDRLNAIDNDIKGLKERDEELSYQISLNASAINAESKRNDEQDKRLSEIENWLAEHDNQLGLHDKSLNEHEAKNQIQDTRLASLSSTVNDLPTLLAQANPVGQTYIQFPGTKEPSELYGGQWVKLFANEGVFFRTEGHHAKGFNSGVQGEMVGPHTHPGPFNTAKGQGYHERGTEWRDSNSMRAINNITKTTGDETRPRNRTIRVWKKVSD